VDAVDFMAAIEVIDAHSVILKNSLLNSFKSTIILLTFKI